MINETELYYTMEIAIVSCTLSTSLDGTRNISIMNKRRQQYVHCSSAAKQARKTRSSIILGNYISEFACHDAVALNIRTVRLFFLYKTDHKSLCFAVNKTIKFLKFNC